MGLHGLEPRNPVLAAPAVEGLLCRSDPAGDLSHCALVDHLLRRVLLLGHLSPFPRPDTNILPRPALGGQVKQAGGCSSYLGWGWSGGEFMTAVAEIVCRTFIGEALGRHKACPYGDHGGRLRGTTWVGDRWHRQYAGDAAPTWQGVGGALRGESPRTREGRRPDRPELQWSVISGQWSETTALALLGDANWLRLSRYQRCTKVHPHFGLHSSRGY